MDAQKTALAGCGAVVGMVAMGLALNALFAWFLMIVLAAFGLHPGFWVCVLIIMLVTALIGGGRAK